MVFSIFESFGGAENNFFLFDCYIKIKIFWKSCAVNNRKFYVFEAGGYNKTALEN